MATAFTLCFSCGLAAPHPLLFHLNQHCLLLPSARAANTTHHVLCMERLVVQLLQLQDMDKQLLQCVGVPERHTQVYA